VLRGIHEDCPRLANSTPFLLRCIGFSKRCCAELSEFSPHCPVVSETIYDFAYGFAGPNLFEACLVQELAQIDEPRANEVEAWKSGFGALMANESSSLRSRSARNDSDADLGGVGLNFAMFTCVGF